MCFCVCLNPHLQTFNSFNIFHDKGVSGNSQLTTFYVSLLKIGIKNPFICGSEGCLGHGDLNKVVANMSPEWTDQVDSNIYKLMS